ncbi:MAG: alpha-acetolactate decarboxylase [Flavobacterium sp. MedPE-SWcel]|uniref:acetolactate decarboxylase n=1 Tax=uncultured Flavobacterium sp. TaxID=165435 RepID=UPI000922753C|nr:acetolactate decarboxylase [uncultured Flavobacterium sp.]OIQ18673.1 MAG: alpha-acetolactate decarboxylase [Flavobacterium sp. MedPE-SWcel]
MIKQLKYVSLLLIVVFIGCNDQNSSINNDVKIVGAMKNVMKKGQLQGTINLDTIGNKQHLYGLGPVEYLSGELMIFDGKSYKSTVTSPTTMTVEETFDVKAPFFGYANIEKWTKHSLPDSISTIKQLENYLDKIKKDNNNPFMFKLSGTMETAKIHVINLPKGIKVSSHQDAHKGLVHFDLKDEKADILGFYSTQHKAILTHHDTSIHLHLLTADKKKMGHLDSVKFKKGSVTLFIPTI